MAKRNYLVIDDKNIPGVRARARGAKNRQYSVTISAKHAKALRRTSAILGAQPYHMLSACLFHILEFLVEIEG